jgi:hypothetical protein
VDPENVIEAAIKDGPMRIRLGSTANLLTRSLLKRLNYGTLR